MWVNSSSGLGLSLIVNFFTKPLKDLAYWSSIFPRSLMKAPTKSSRKSIPLWVWLVRSWYLSHNSVPHWVLILFSFLLVGLEKRSNHARRSPRIESLPLCCMFSIRIKKFEVSQGSSGSPRPQSPVTHSLFHSLVWVFFKFYLWLIIGAPQGSSTFFAGSVESTWFEGQGGCWSIGQYWTWHWKQFPRLNEIVTWNGKWLTIEMQAFLRYY